MDPKLIEYQQELLAACQRSDAAQAMKMLNYGASPDCSNLKGNTPLMIACETGNMTIIKLLIAGKANLNIHNKVGYTALDIACRDGRSDIVELLLANKADPNAIPNDSGLCGDSPLTTACRYGSKTNIKIIKKLLAAGADPGQQNGFGHSPFMVACWNNHPDVVKLFLERNVNLNAVDVEGNTALLKALHYRFDRKKIILMLIEAGADLTIKDKNGYTAAENDSHGVIDWAQKEIQNQRHSLKQIFSVFKPNSRRHDGEINSQHPDLARRAR